MRPEAFHRVAVLVSALLRIGLKGGTSQTFVSLRIQFRIGAGEPGSGFVIPLQTSDKRLQPPCV